MGSEVPPDKPGEFRCRECWAINRQPTTMCWLCGASFDEEIPYAEIVGEPPVVTSGESPIFFWMAMLLCGAFAIVFLGALLEDVESAIGMIILAVPGLIAVLVRSARKHAQGQSMGWGDRIVTFLLTTAAIAGIISLLAVAAAVAFFIYCVMALQGKL